MESLILLGLVYLVLPFVSLGMAPIGIGYLYQRFVPLPQETASQP